MIYADYTYYVSEFRGTLIAEEDFDAAALRASLFLDYYTMNRAKQQPELEALKLACCALAEEYHTIITAARQQSQTMAGDGEMQSQTVGGYSVTYRSRGEALSEASAQAQSRLAQVARQYLAHTGLLYRGGVCRCTHRTL